MFLSIGQYFEIFLILLGLALAVSVFKNVNGIAQTVATVVVRVTNIILRAIFRLLWGRRRRRSRHGKKSYQDFNNNNGSVVGSVVEEVAEEQGEDGKDKDTDDSNTEPPRMNRLQIFLMGLTQTLWDYVVLLTLSAYYIVETITLSLTPTSLRNRKSLRDKVVLITGGAGGVGQELAIRLAKLRAKVVIWDVNEKAIEKVQERFEKENVEVHSYVVDVTDKKSVEKTADTVKYQVGPVDILINNAGIVCGQTFMELPEDMIEKTFKVNVISHYWTIKAFLSDMIEREQGHIVTVGSLTGLLGTYKCCDYSATKFATVGLHESLLTELKTHGHNYIHMTLVCPYFINTGMFDGCKPKNLPMLEPKEVAKRIVTAIQLDEVFVTLPGFARFALPLKHYIPAKLAWAMMYRLIQGPQSMMGLRTHQNEIRQETIRQEIAAA